jgi:hypothetical protein
MNFWINKYSGDRFTIERRDKDTVTLLPLNSQLSGDVRNVSVFTFEQNYCDKNSKEAWDWLTEDERDEKDRDLGVWDDYLRPISPEEVAEAFPDNPGHYRCPNCSGWVREDDDCICGV